MASTTWISGADGSSRGLRSCRPSMSVRMMSASARTSRATSAESVSLSPKTISSTATVSFSLMMGSAPMSSRRSKAFSMFMRRRRSSTQSRVSSTWAVTWPYSLNSLSYMYISSHWPTAAQACRPPMSCGRRSSLSLPTPTPMAPEETSTISRPAFFRSESTRARSRMRRRFSLPVSCVSVEVPTLNTRRFAPAK